MLRNKRAMRRFGAVAVSLALVTAACGGDDDAGSGPEETGGGGDTGGGEETAETGGDTGGGDTGGEETATGGGDTGGGGSGDRTTVTWFVGLGTGSQEEQIPQQQALIDEYNANQDEIFLEVQFVDNNTAKDALATLIGGGTPPDIVGPVGREGANAFPGEWLDLSELIESEGVDLSLYEQTQVDAYTNPDGTVHSLPFASFPSALYYNTELFDEAGLPYPPAEYGEPYGVGTEWEGDWDWAKVEELSQILTVDANGNDATSPDFDPSSIQQWGYTHQWTAAPKAQGTNFGAGNIMAEDGTADVPDQWVEEWKWYHNLIHNLHSSPTGEQLDGDILSGNAFNSGKVAMARTHLWYTCCLTDADGNGNTFWNVAAVPSHNGVVTANLHADTFRVHKDTANAEAALAVLKWIQEEKALEFLTIYGAMPARTDLRDPYFAALEERFPQGVSWQTFLDGLQYIDNPSHELDMPAFAESDLRIKELEPLINNDADLDIDAYVEQLEADLDAIWANA